MHFKKAELAKDFEEDSHAGLRHAMEGILAELDKCGLCATAARLSHTIDTLDEETAEI